jgi:hypothetical protein
MKVLSLNPNKRRRRRKYSVQYENTEILKIIRVMLTCALRAHVKQSKKRNFALEIITC